MIGSTAVVGTAAVDTAGTVEDIVGIPAAGIAGIPVDNFELEGTDVGLVEDHLLCPWSLLVHMEEADSFPLEI